MSCFCGTPLLFFELYDVWPHQMGVTCITHQDSNMVSELSLGESDDFTVEEDRMESKGLAEVVVAEEDKEEFLMIGSHCVSVYLSKEHKSSFVGVKEMETERISETFNFGSINWIKIKTKRDEEDEKSMATPSSSFLADLDDKAVHMEENVDSNLDDVENPKYDDLYSGPKQQETQKYIDIMQKVEEALKKGLKVSIQGMGLEDDPEDQLLVGCNVLLVDIENKIVIINNFICDKYCLKFLFEVLVYHPIDYAHIVKKACRFGKKNVLFFNLVEEIFVFLISPYQRGRPPELQNLVGIYFVQQLINLPCGFSLLGYFRGTKDAKKLFEELLVRNVMSWNILICVADVRKARAVAFVSKENV
ncbi:U4/U6 small nuclear ribonucleoprotein Prp31 [Spatholobus suberectus]|nr:U4/U6 small nuclear ribonucleoprotein Prp31 [Spatholobus suberectus]